MADTFFGITDTGKQRTNNEDAFIAQAILGDRFICTGVIDGVGGYEGGEVAASIAKQAILNYFSVPSGSIGAMLQEAVVSANEKIYAEKKQSGKYESMACVLTIAVVDKAQHKFYYAHVGDTRLYLFRDGSLVKISKDQSFVGFLEDSGRLTEAEAMAHPKRNEINKALGFEVPLPAPSEYIEIGESPFLPGDLLLLCSDGLTDMVTRKELTDILATKKSLAVKAKAMVDAANAAGGKDNITVVLVQNGAKPNSSKATKTAAPVKKNDLQQNREHHPPQEEIKVPATNNTGEKKDKYKLLFFITAMLLLLTAGLLVWRLFDKKEESEDGLIHPNSVQKNSPEQALQDTINGFAGDTLKLTNETFGSPVLLTDTLYINRSNLYMLGNGTQISADSMSGNNAVIYLAPTATNIMFDSLVFQNLMVLIHPQNKSSVRFKDSKFINTTLQIIEPVYFKDTTVNGSILKLLPVPDSLKRKN